MTSKLNSKIEADHSVFVDIASAKTLLGKHIPYDLKLDDTNFSLFVKSASYDSAICEMSLSIKSVDFIDLIKRSNVYSQIKIVPSYFMRILCVRNINELVSIPDVSFVLSKLTVGAKKIVLANDLNCIGLNQKVFFVEYDTHVNAKHAIKVLNSRPDWIKVLSSRNKISTPIEATWIPPCVDLYDEVLTNTACFFFENLSVLTTDVMKFKKFLDSFLIEHEDKAKINKIRQYGNKILVQFDQRPDCLLRFVMSHKEYLKFEGKSIPVIPAMKPIVNVGKYREKTAKVSSHLLSEEDKRMMVNIFDLGFSDGHLRKKAEMAYNRILLDEKREREKEKEKEMERERNLHRDKGREFSGKGKNFVSKTDENFHEKYLSKKIERKHRDGSYDSKERIRRGSGRVKDKDITDGKDRTRLEGDNKLMSTILNLGQQGTNLSQLATLLPLLNLSGGNTNIQSAITSLLNLQTMIKNPSVMELVQQLSSINSSTNTATPSTNQTQISQSVTSTTNSNQINPQANFNQGNYAYSQTKPSATPQPTQINPIPSNQINPMYTMPKNNPSMDLNQNFYPIHGGTGVPNQNLKQPGYYNNPYNTYNNVNEMYMHPNMYLSGQEFQTQANDMNLNMNMDQLKNYYDYLQSLNK